MRAEAYKNESKQSYATPWWFMDQLEEDVGEPYDLDPCCWHETAIAPYFYTPLEDGIASPWGPFEHRKTRVFCNPPWNDPLPWIDKAITEIDRGACELVTFLLGAKTETKWYRTLHEAGETWLVYPRLNYFDGVKLKPGINVGSALFHLGEFCQPGRVAHYHAPKPKGAIR